MFAVNFLTALQVRSDWFLLAKSQFIIFARFLTKSPCMRRIYGKSRLSRIIKTNFFTILHSKKDGSFVAGRLVCHLADVLAIVLIVLDVLELAKEVLCKSIYACLPGFLSLGVSVNKDSLTDCVNQTVPC